MFLRREEKPEYPGKNLPEQSKEPTNSTHIWRRVRESKPGHIGRRRVLSPLCHHCSVTYKGVFSIAITNTTRTSLKYRPPNNSLVCTREVNRAFGARWLASSEVISQILFTSEHRAARETLKIDDFSVNCYRYSSFWRYLFNLCGIY